MVTLILGRAGTGKTALVMERIRTLGRDGTQSILIVPEQFSHDAERQLCESCGDAVSLYAEVLSFSRLSNRVFAETGGLARKTLDAGGRVLVMNAALTALESTLRVYHPGRRRTDFIRGLLHTYDELKGACAPLEQLRDAGNQASGALGDKLCDLADIFSAYEALLPAGTADPGERLADLADEIGEAGQLEGKHVFLDGFTDFTGQEAEIVDRLIRRGSDVTVCLVCDGPNGDEPAFTLPRRTAARLLRTAAETGAKSEIVNMGDVAGKKRETLRKAEEVLLTRDEERFDGSDGSIRVYRETSRSRECALAAAEAVRLVRETGCRWRDIGVTARGFEDYEILAESEFSQYGVPVMMTRKEDILQKPVMALISAALDAVTGGWEYAPVFRYLKTGLSGFAREETDLLENYVLKWNLRGAKTWAGEWTMNPEGYNRETTDSGRRTLKAVNALRERLYRPFSALQKRLKNAEDGAAMVKSLYDFLEETELPAHLEAKTGALEKAGRLQLADEYRQLWDILTGALEQSFRALAGQRTDGEEFARLMKLTLSQYSVASIPVSVDRVAMGDSTRMRKRNLKHLIVLGATEDRMPMLSPDPGVFSDDERDRLIRMGVRLSDDTESKISRELYGIYVSLTLPSDSLTLIVSPSADGKIRPSFAVKRLETVFGLREQTAGEETGTGAFGPCAELALSAPSGDPLALAAREALSDRPEIFERLETAERFRHAMEQDLSPELTEKLYAKKLNLTASRVDKYQSCRMAYFLQYGLSLKPRKRAAFDAPEVGTFVHDILENTARETEKMGGFHTVSREQIAETADKYIARYAEERLDGFRGKTQRFRYLFDRLAAETRQIVADMAEELARSDFRPLDFELDFSAGGDLPPYETDGGRLSVIGRVDRVDGWIRDGRLYLRILDYKTGLKSFSLSDVWYGLGMQMLIYLSALGEHGRERYGKEIVPAGVLYVPARDVILSEERDISEEKLAAEREKTVRRSGLLLGDQKVLEAMESGDKTRFLPVRVSGDGVRSGDALVTAEQLGCLARHIDTLLTRMSREIRRGGVGPDPCFRSQRDNACVYCEYNSVCHFGDAAARGRLRYLRHLGNQEAWEKLREEEKQ